MNKDAETIINRLRELLDFMEDFATENPGKERCLDRHGLRNIITKLEEEIGENR